MHSKNIRLFFIAAFLTSTSLGLHHLVVIAQRSLDIFLARQLDTGQCASLCSTVGTTVTSCTTTDCLCTAAIAASIQVCINCAVGDNPTVGIVSSAQSLIDTFENLCSTVAGVPSVTINTTPGTSSHNTPTAVVPSTANVPSTIAPVTTISQVVIGPSSTTSAPTGISSVGGTSTTSIGGFPFKSSASPNKIILHWTVALLGLAAGNLLIL